MKSAYFVQVLGLSLKALKLFHSKKKLGRRLFTIAKYIRLYHNSKIYQNEYNNISKYQTISLYQNISASKINITIMGTISEIYHVSCEWVKNREAEVHMHAIIEGHADQNQRKLF